MIHIAPPGDLIARLPKVRGAYDAAQPLSEITWFRVGGPADVLFRPKDADDLAAFMRARPKDVPVMAIGVGSNLLVRDKGVRGVVIRLGAGFNQIVAEENNRVRAGAAALDTSVAQAAAKANIAGLEFLRGIPGTVGGGLRMNAGAYGREFKDSVIAIKGVTDTGEIVTLAPVEMGWTYRHSNAPAGMIFVEAVFQGVAGERTAIEARMNEITTVREATQPVKTRTGGSTFKNPEGHKAWQLIEAAGCRGLVRGDAQVSEMHCNFLINRGNASAADIEGLGEDVRKLVREKSGVTLEWEIMRIGENGGAS